ncbi:alpha/beta hydrolase [Mesobaculum littorinae]|uniref:Alpha/beta hydrolase n=1 Tax=Mesobaculum littorinae TaxID=2486419 RepID=A0A438AJG5_9RHOB|nr:alpha/beta hydrolase [Mesobaculum littorinae]RVV98747.1 alpha/beta hydrolase [Mesobaculum littorinae]
MPLLAVNASDEIGAIAARLAPHLAATRGPVIVMVHGFKYTPDISELSPHAHILSLDPRPSGPRAVSWPRHLGCGRGTVGAPDAAAPPHRPTAPRPRTGDDTAEPLCIGFGWDGGGSLWRAWRAAALAGGALARLVRHLHACSGRPVQIIAHSMGARVALRAATALPPGSIGRVVLLFAAAFRSDARRALDSPAGASAEWLNVTSRENDLFDLLLELALCAPERTLGAGLKRPAGNWLDMQVDDPATLSALAALGHRVAAPERRICHWSGYLRAGLFPLYRRVLSGDPALPFSTLRAALPQRQRRRWSRLLAPPASLPTLFVRRA